MNIIKITTAKLANLFLSFVQEKTITVVTDTDAKLKKTNNPYVGTRKISKKEYKINFNYETEVNRQRYNENSPTDFKKSERKWGVRINNSNMITHNGNLYVEMLLEKSFGNSYVFNGVELDKSLIEDYLPSISSNKNQQLAQEKIVNTIALDNIKSVLIDNDLYVVEN